jgi:hypothetical protein
VAFRPQQEVADLMSHRVTENYLGVEPHQLGEIEDAV